MNNTSSRAVPLPKIVLFLVRKEEDGVPKAYKSIKVYNTFDCTLYTRNWFNTEAKLRVHHNKLRMEFYIDFLQSFAMKGENILSVYSRSKFLLAAKVRF